LVLTGRCANRSGRPVAITRSVDAVAGSYSGRSATVIITSDSSSKSSGDSPSRCRQAFPSNACRLACWSDAQRCPQHPRLVLRETNSAQLGPVDERLDPRNGNHEPGRLQLPVHLLGGVHQLMPGKLLGNLGRTRGVELLDPLAPGPALALCPQVSRPTDPPGRSTRQASASPAVGRGRWNNMKAITTASKDPSANGSSAASPTSSGKSRGPRATIASVRSRPTIRARGATLSRCGSSAPTPQPRSKTRRASASGSSSSSHRARPTRTGAHRSR
jgi:hypothetical protein